MRQSLPVQAACKAVFHHFKTMRIDGMQMQEEPDNQTVMYSVFNHDHYFRMGWAMMQENINKTRVNHDRMEHRRKQMKRSQEREKAMIAVYQYLLVNRDVDTLIEDTYERKKAEVDPYFTTLVHTAIDNAALYEGYINDVLKEGWKFARLGAIEKAILLCGCSEFEMKQTQAAVIIDEYVELAKKFCDEDAYRLINRVLDII